MKIIKNKNQSGQVLIAVVFIIALALASGVTMSSRFVKSLQNYTQVDNLNKATSIAEAGIEKILLIPSDTLKSYAQNNTCGSNCHVEVTDTNGQIISADITLTLTGQSSTVAYPVSLSPTQTTEIFLTGYSSNQNVYVCWNTSASVEGIYIYTQSGVTKAASYAYNAAVSTHDDNNFSTALSLFGYSSCMTVPASNTPVALRLKSYYLETDAYVLPATGHSLPIQGILITAIGKANNSQKTISVLKTNSYTPTMFDYVLYQKSESDTLSN